MFFLTGTDEHGEKIQKMAESKQITPKQLADSVSEEYCKTWKEMGISFNKFIRTTDDEHIQVVRKILKETYEKGDIYFGEYEGFYCVGCERYLSKDELTAEGKCPDHLQEPNRVKEQNYFFKMEKFRERLVKHIQTNPSWLAPDRFRSEILSLLKEPIDDLCISRPKSRISWGIELPFDDRYVTYVWFDALINYISAIGFPDDPDFNKRWSGAVHFIGKDILKAHAIYWPTMLMSMGYPLPAAEVVHGYWKSEGQKMSKSLGNVIKPLEMKSKVGGDVFRYYILKEMNFGSDSDFRMENLRLAYNADLANNWGNLINRVQSLTEKTFGAVIPAPLGDQYNTEIDRIFKHEILELSRQVKVEMESFVPYRAIATIFATSRRVNKYIDDRAPWKLAKEAADPLGVGAAAKKNELGEVMYNTWEAVRLVACHLFALMPETTTKVFKILNLQTEPDAPIDPVFLDISKFGVLRAGALWNRGAAVYPRME